LDTFYPTKCPELLPLVEEVARERQYLGVYDPAYTQVPYSAAYPPLSVGDVGTEV
jgi:hypothetical protein